MSVKVKICGVTTPDQADMVQSFGADALGLVFYSSSPRYINAKVAKDIRKIINSNCLCVALLVNADVSFVYRVIEELKPDLLQFHGDESPSYCHQFNYPFIRAVSMRQGLDINSIVRAYRPQGGFLFDNGTNNKYGGTGESFDWTLLPKNRKFSLILAGGLLPQNVRDAVKIVGPEMVDVSSGVECSPGLKDPQLVNQFVKNAKSI